MAGRPKPFHVGTMSRGNAYDSGRALQADATKGMNALVQNFAGFCEWLGVEVMPEVLVEALEPTMDLSDKYAPKDTGVMVNSRYNEVRGSRAGPRAEVGYNKHGEAPYTIFVHEMPQFYHNPPTQYKFLERALNEDTPEIVGRLAAGLKKRSGL
jgi:hypothetical protein